MRLLSISETYRKTTSRKTTSETRGPAPWARLSAALSLTRGGRPPRGSGRPAACAARGRTLAIRPEYDKDRLAAVLLSYCGQERDSLRQAPALPHAPGQGAFHPRTSRSLGRGFGRGRPRRSCHQGGFGSGQIRTKTEIADLRTGLKTEIAGTKTDLLKWIIGAIGFQTVVILGAGVSLARVFAK
jgi:hypothetical protein